MIIEKLRVDSNVDGTNSPTRKGHFHEDEQLLLSFQKKRHLSRISGEATTNFESCRIHDRLKTVSVGLVLCLNIGFDPPDVVKIKKCARLECWIDPLSIPLKDTMEIIGRALKKQYELLLPRAHYNYSFDPIVEDVKMLCSSLRRKAKNDRVLFHYNGHGVPLPTVKGDIWVFNEKRTKYLPLSIYDLQTCLGAPTIYVYDCSNAGEIVNSFNRFAEARELEEACAGGIRGHTPEVATTSAGSTSTATVSTTGNAANTFRNCIQFAACASNQLLPMNPKLPADLFTSCLTTPIKTALKWFTLQKTATLLPNVTYSHIVQIPGVLNDRRTMLGELNWIFISITDTIAWNTFPHDLFKKLFRQDVQLSSLFRNFLLADRIMRSYDCTPISVPALPKTHHHPMWAAWDLAVDQALRQLPDILDNNAKYVISPFFEDQLTAFHLWLDRGSSERNPPEQLPGVLQLLLSQFHRLRALEVLCRFVDLGPWAINSALAIDIFPYVLKLLQAPVCEWAPHLVFIWAKILTVDESCQMDLVSTNSHKYFLAVLQDLSIPTHNRTFAVFVLASILHDFPVGQKSALQCSLICSVCLSQLNDTNALHRQWSAICLGHLWQNYDTARWSGIRDLAHEKLYPLLVDPVPEVRAAAVYALGTFISSQQEDRNEQANNIDRSIAITILTTVGNDMSPVVRMELVVALQWMILLFEKYFVSIYLQESSMETSAILVHSSPAAACTISLPSRGLPNDSSPSNSSIANIFGMDPLSNLHSPKIGFGSIYKKLWHGLMSLCYDPHPDVAQLSQTVINYIVTQALDIIEIRKATKKNIGLSTSLPSLTAQNINLPTHMKSNDDSMRLPSAFNEAKTKFTLMPNNVSINEVFPKRPINDATETPSEGAKESQKTSRRNLGSGKTDAADDSSKQIDTKTPKPIVSTNFIPWCASHFSTPIWRQEPEQPDRFAPDQLDRMRRFQRNTDARTVAREIQRRAVDIRLETQSWIGRTQNTPNIVKLHPYELEIAVAYKNKIIISDWNLQTIMSCDPHPLNCVTKVKNPIVSHQSWVSALEFINSHDRALILAGYNDGCIRIWATPPKDSKESRLVTAWQSLHDFTLNKLYHKTVSDDGFGLRAVWQQRSQNVIVAGDVKYVRCWDAEAEMRICDIPTGADSASVHVLSSASNELIVAGCTDGSVRLFDKRLAPASARVMTYLETGGKILTACLRDDCGHLVTGCSLGSIRLFDIRQNSSFSHWFVVGVVNAVSVHTSADILACATTNFISVYGLDGKLLNEIHPPAFMGARVGKTVCLSFHPLNVSLAAGFLNNIVTVYESNTK